MASPSFVPLTHRAPLAPAATPVGLGGGGPNDNVAVEGWAAGDASKHQFAAQALSTVRTFAHVRWAGRRRRRIC